MIGFPDYDFSPFLDALGHNGYAEDELQQRILARFAHDYYVAYQRAALVHYRQASA